MGRNVFPQVLEKGLLNDEGKAQDLAYEARILSGCSHSSIVQFVGWGVLHRDSSHAETMTLEGLLQSDAEVFLAQEYAAGGTLKVRGGPATRTAPAH